SRALHSAQDIANLHGRGVVHKRVTSPLPAHAAQKPRLHERTGELFKVLEGNAFVLRHLAQRHPAPRFELSNPHHEPQRIAPFRRHEHRRHSSLAHVSNTRSQAGERPAPHGPPRPIRIAPRKARCSAPSARPRSANIHALRSRPSPSTAKAVRIPEPSPSNPA